MQINSIELINFRQYKKEIIEFSCDKEKNVTVLLGDNTSGKTTLVKAFIWCLYRINTFSDRILLNSDEADYMAPEKTRTAKVIITLEHNNYSYQITTKEEYGRNSNGTVCVVAKAHTSILKIDSNGSVPVLRPEEEINDILDPELKEYFFFDGETNSIESVSSKKNLTEAVSDILGLKGVEKLQDYYNPTSGESVTSKLQSKLISMDDDLESGLSDQLSKLYDEKESKDNKVKENNKQIEQLIELIADKEKILDENKEIAVLQTRKKDLEKKLIDEKKRKEEKFSSLLNQLSTANGFLNILFGYSYVKNNLSTVLSESTFSSESSLSHISEEAVDQLIKRGYCLCGTKITDGSQALEHLKEAKEHMEPRDYGKYASRFEDSEKGNLFHSETLLNDLQTEADNLLNLIAEIDADNETYKDTIKKIAGTLNIGEVQQLVQTYREQKAGLEQTNKYIETTILPEINDKINQINSKITSAASQNKENEFTNLCLAYATKIYDLVSKKITKSKAEIREKLEFEIGNIFKDMYHGNRNIKIDDNFRAITVVTKDGGDKALDRSTGLETVKNFAFVAGLMKLVKERITKDEYSDEDTIDETYPLVMDAPFSNTDETHIYNICKALPKYCDQIIIVVMEKDYKYAETALSGKIGKTYKLSKVSETETKVVEDK